MPKEAKNSQIKKGVLDLIVLLLIYQKNTYPNEILSLLKEAGLETPEATIYPLLNRLKKDDFLSYEWIESSSGHPKKYFQITDLGKAAMFSKLKFFKEIQEIVNHLSSQK